MPSPSISIRRATLAVSLLASPMAKGVVENDPWAFDFTPYLWVASIDVETRLPDAPTAGASDVSRFETQITGGAMLAGKVRYRSVGLWMDAAWLQLNTEATQPGPAFSKTELDSDIIHGTAALFYRLPLDDRFQVEILAGARVWSIHEELNAAPGLLPGFTTDTDQTWVDPIVGADLRYQLSSRWSLQAKGIVGGFGVNSDIAGEVLAGVNFRLTDWFSTSLGYRYLHENYDQQGFDFKSDIHGFVLGAGFHF